MVALGPPFKVGAHVPPITAGPHRYLYTKANTGSKRPYLDELTLPESAATLVAVSSIVEVVTLFLTLI